MPYAEQITSDFKGDHLSVTMFGDAAAVFAAAAIPIQEAAAIAMADGRSLFFPAGDYNVDNSTGALIISGCTGRWIFDEGARLVFSTVNQPGIRFSNAQKLTLDNIRVKWATTPVTRTEDDHAIEIIDSDHITLLTPKVENGPAFGILLENCHTTMVMGGLVENTMSDGVHHRDCINFHVMGCTAKNTGDDGFSCTAEVESYGGVLTSIITENSAKRGIAIVGPSNVSISNFTVKDSAAAGIVVLSDAFSGSLTSKAIKISHGKLESCGSVAEAGSHAIVVYEAYAGGLEAEFNDIEVRNSYYSGVYVPGNAAFKDIRVTFNNVRVYNAGATTNEFGFKFECCYPTVNNCRVYGSPHYGYYFDRCKTVKFNNIEGLNAGSAVSDYRMVWFTDCEQVYGDGILVEDDRTPAQSYAIGDFQSGTAAIKGRITGYKFAIHDGTVPIVSRNVGEKFQWQTDSTSPIYFRNGDDSSIPDLLVAIESGYIVARDPTDGEDAWAVSIYPGCNEVHAFGGVDNTLAAEWVLDKGTFGQHGQVVMDLPVPVLADAGKYVRVTGLGDAYELTTLVIPDPINDGWYVMTPSGGAVTPDLANGRTHTADVTANLAINAPIKTSGSIVAGDMIVIRVLTNATVGWVTTFNAAYKLPAGIIADQRANMMSNFVFRYNGSSWEYAYGSQGIPL